MNQPILFVLIIWFTGFYHQTMADNIVSNPEMLKAEYDVVIAGATPGGLAMGIRCAREGHSVLIVEPIGHIGGLLTSGLGTMDTYYYKARSPILDEVYQRLDAHYNNKAFDDENFERQSINYKISFLESFVMERIFIDMVNKETNLTILTGYYSKTVDRSQSKIEAVRFQQMDGTGSFKVKAKIFADATYEGDLAALAGVSYRIGRESRSEFNEPHAGRTFTKLVHVGHRPAAIQDIKVDMHSHSTEEIPTEDTGEGDNAIQAYNYRLTLSNDPENMRLPPKPENYNPEAYQLIRERFHKFGRKGSHHPNKMGWNAAILPGMNHHYPTSSWQGRKEIAKIHLDWAIGLLHYLQEDSDLPKWGLALDEYQDNNNVPYMLYVREARRIIGRDIFTEHDGLLSADFNRAPINHGSIAITEWSLDSHACTTDRVPGSRPEGKVLLSEITVPGQVDFNCLLAPDLKNFIVPVCLSSTHIGWGTIRLEPTWMHIGESAAYAASMAIKEKVEVDEINIDAMQVNLAEERILLSYFNDVEVIDQHDYIPALQYLGTKGFFTTYNAMPEMPLDEITAFNWSKMLALLLQNKLDPNQQAKTLHDNNLQIRDSKEINQKDFLLMINKELESLDLDLKINAWEGYEAGAFISRGTACRLIYNLIKSRLK